MLWLIIAVFIVAAYFLYKNFFNTVHLSKNQLELMKDLVEKERQEIKIKKQEIINEGAKQGKTIPIAPIIENLDNLIKENKDNLEFITQIEKVKSDLIKEHGTHIPVDAAYKLLNKIEDEIGPV